MRTHLPAGIEQPGDRISHYELVVVLGEGGFGTVWQARQSEPIRREVALKLIKPGMDSREILARFETEKQTLARMEHPNIAGVLDAGTTETGRPYFVMELIQGVPITEYCDAKHLSLRQRLELFIPVCHAVQHAHQKAVLHRDLKPSNILVTEVDGRAVPKVIDFGIAKALSGTAEQVFQTRLAHTMEGLVIGTPQYMSPEQAGAKADIDTRSDIYTLGVILYELLTGTTPLTRDELKRTAFDEMLRLVREHESVRPSSRVQPLSAADTRTCTSFGMEPGRLTRLLRGDLDWITLKALEKDRERRYETANALAEDIQRHLNQEPVSAAAPSAAYRLKKLIRRNRAAFAAAAAIVITLVAATGFSVWQADRATRAEKDTRDALLVAERHRNEAQTNLALARKAVDDYLNNVTDNPRLQQADFLALRRQLLETALPFYERFVQQQSDDPSLLKDQAMALSKLGEIYGITGQPAKAEGVYKRARAFQDRLPPELKDDPEYQLVLSSITSNSSNSLKDQGKDAEAESALRQAMATQEELLRSNPADLNYRRNLAISLDKLAKLCHFEGRNDEAEPMFRRAIDLTTRLVSEKPDAIEFAISLAGMKNNYGNLLHKTGRVVDAVATGQEALDLLEQVASKFGPRLEQRDLQAVVHTALAVQFRELGRPQDAKESFQHALAILETLAGEFPSRPTLRARAASIHVNLGSVLGDMGRNAEAEASCQRGIDMVEKLSAEFPDLNLLLGDFVGYYNDLGAFQARQRKFAEAERAYRKGLEVSRKAVALRPNAPDPQRQRATSHTNLGMLWMDQGRFADALLEFRQALELWEKVARDFPEIGMNRIDLAGARHNLAMVLTKDQTTHAEARRLFEQAIDTELQELAINPQDRKARRYMSNHLFAICGLCLEQGDHATAALRAYELAQLDSNVPGAQVTAASFIARCIPLVHQDPATPQADRADVAELYARQAVELLRGAVSLGFKEFDKVKVDPAFTPLLTRAYFKELIGI